MYKYDKHPKQLIWENLCWFFHSLENCSIFPAYNFIYKYIWFFVHLQKIITIHTIAKSPNLYHNSAKA